MSNIIGPKAGNQVNKSEVDTFIKFLSNPNTQIPVDSNFLIHFETLPEALNSYSDDAIPDGSNPWSAFEGQWDVESTLRSLVQEVKNQSQGAFQGQVCLFANGINIPGESIGTERGDALPGPSGGLIGGVVSMQRGKYGDLTVSFLETNKSFIDFVIRPWITLVGHYGLINRDPTSSQNVKANISIYHYDKNDITTNNGIRRVFTFNGCAPISIGEASYTYGKQEMRVEPVKFVFNNYKIAYDPSRAGSVPKELPATTNTTPKANNPFITAFNNGLANPKLTPINFNNPMLNSLNNGIAAGRGITPVNFNNPMLNALNNGIAAGKK